MGGIDGGDAGVAMLLLIAFITGVAGGVMLIVSLASRREDRLYTLPGQAPGPACEGARWLTGVGVRGSGFLSSTRRYDQDGTGNAHGQVPER
jgi:hypothetical protein